MGVDRIWIGHGKRTPHRRSTVPLQLIHAEHYDCSRTSCRRIWVCGNSPPFRISPPVINVKVLEAVKINNLHCSPDPPVINVKVLEAVKINNLHCSPPENTQSPTLGGRGTPGRQDIRPRRAGSGRDRGNSDGGNGVGSAACTAPRLPLAALSSSLSMEGTGWAGFSVRSSPTRESIHALASLESACASDGGDETRNSSPGKKGSSRAGHMDRGNVQGPQRIPTPTRKLVACSCANDQTTWATIRTDNASGSSLASLRRAS